MSAGDRRLEKLGHALRTTDDRIGPGASLARVRGRLLAARAAARAEPARLRRAMFAVVAAAVVILGIGLGAWVLGGWALLRPPAPIAFEVGQPPERGTVGAFLVTGGDAPLPVTFSEGSSIVLLGNSQMRVTHTTPTGASVLIERGSLSAKIAHAEGVAVSWSFYAGPFQLEVVGTAFDASWDPNREVLEVVLREGAVRVHGPVVAGRDLKAGERLVVDLRDGRVEIAFADRAAAHRDAPVTPEVVASAEPAPTATASAASSAPSASESDWQTLAAAGRHKDAMRALDDDAFSRVVGTSGGATLRSLADAARLGGRPDRARAALLELRERLGARGETAFLLGRIASDQLRSPAEARRWFEAYLDEAPNGPLAEQALGRLLELGAKGDRQAARALAERYLARYPNGSHARLARSIIDP